MEDWRFMSKMKKFEEEKQKLAQKGLPYDVYEKAVQKLCRKYRV
jgi:hypothetical protein